MSGVIERVSVSVLVEPGEADNRRRLALVSVSADDGTTGFGEAAASPWAVAAYVRTRSVDLWDASPQDLLLGLPASDPRGAWELLQGRTFWSARAGLGYVAAAAVDTALWDLAARLAGVPVWRFAGDSPVCPLRAYATLYHGEGTLAFTLDRVLADLERARQAGYTAVKVEGLTGNTRDVKEIVELVRVTREAAGPDMTLMLDVGYRWTDVDEAVDCARLLAPYDLLFLEAPFPASLVEAYRQLSKATDIPIASGDMLTAPFEYAALLDAGVDIVQAGCARTGFSGVREVAKMAADRGKSFIPWGFAGTPFAAAANIHACLGQPNVPILESAPPLLYPDARLRRDLGGPEPTLTDGHYDIPTTPGYGITLNHHTLEQYTQDGDGDGIA